MAKAKKDKNKKSLLTTIKGMDTISKTFIVGFIVAGVVLTGVTVNYIKVNNDAYLRSTEYEDPSVNFVLVPPKEWAVTTPSRSNVEKIIRETTEGLKFDVTRYALKEEIVPIVLVENVSESKTKGVSGSSFISVALRGYDSSRDRLYDKKYCEEYLGVLLNELGVKDVKYTFNEELSKGYFNGTMVKAEGKDSGTKVYYTQYQEIIGKNVLTLTYGSIDAEDDGYEYIKDTVKHLRFKVLDDGEYFADKISNNSVEVDGDVTNKASDESKDEIKDSKDDTDKKEKDTESEKGDSKTK